MRPGFPTSSPPGEPEEFLLDFVPRENADGNGAILPLTPAVGYGGMFWVCGADRVVQQIVFLPDGMTVEVQVIYDPAVTGHHSHFCEPLGGWNTYDEIDVVAPTVEFEEQRGAYLVAQFTGSMEFTGTLGSDQLTAWNLLGFSRFATSSPVTRRPQEAKADVTLTKAGSILTVVVSLGGVTLCSGSRTGDGTITLVEQNNSGVSGSVAAAWTVDITSGVSVVKRWAARYVVTVGGSDTVTVYDGGNADILTARLGPLAAGSYTLSITPYSDTGVSGTAVTTPALVPGAPEAPGPLTNFTGDYSNTVVRFLASVTPGATYALYQSEEIGGPVNVTAAVATHVAGSGVISWQLPAWFASAGARRIMIVAVNGGIEDGTRRKLAIVYGAGGTRVVEAPNALALKFKDGPDMVTAGLALHLDYVYSAAGERAVPTLVRVVLENINTGAQATTDFAIAGLSNGVRRGSVVVTAGVEGWFRAKAYALQYDGPSVPSPIDIIQARVLGDVLSVQTDGPSGYAVGNTVTLAFDDALSAIFNCAGTYIITDISNPLGSDSFSVDCVHANVAAGPFTGTALVLVGPVSSPSGWTDPVWLSSDVIAGVTNLSVTVG